MDFASFFAACLAPGRRTRGAASACHFQAGSREKPTPKAQAHSRLPGCQRFPCYKSPTRRGWLEGRRHGALLPASWPTLAPGVSFRELPDKLRTQSRDKLRASLDEANVEVIRSSDKSKSSSLVLRRASARRVKSRVEGLGISKPQAAVQQLYDLCRSQPLLGRCICLSLSPPAAGAAHAVKYAHAFSSWCP